MKRINYMDIEKRGSSASPNSFNEPKPETSRVRKSKQDMQNSNNDTPKPESKKPMGTTGKVSQGKGVTNKDKSVDFKNKRIKDSLLKMEKSLGVRNTDSNGNCVKSNLPITEFIDNYNIFIKALSRTQKQKMVVDLQNGLSLLQMVNNYIRYYREVRISFAGFESMREIITVLRIFKYDLDDLEEVHITASKDSRKKKKRQRVRHLNTIWTILNVIDGKSSKARATYAYRFLRLFGLCVMVGDYVSASVIADILLEQITYEQQLKRRSVNNV